jgi:hypothetical protein
MIFSENRYPLFPIMLEALSNIPKIVCISRTFPTGFDRNIPLPFPLLSIESALRFVGRRRNVAQVYFHCSNSEEVWIDRGGTAVGNLAEAHERAVVVVHALIMTHSEEDWRGWVLHVNDDLGEEIFEVPFTSLLGKPH